jgi:hypothetical protein
MKCQICDRKFKANNALSIHLYYSHNISKKDYYDAYIKNEYENICIFCGEKTEFTDHITSGYKIICKSPECIKKLRKETNRQKYGVEYATQNKEVKEKTRKTVKEKYGGYTLDSSILRNKVEKTNLIKFGVKNVFGSYKIKSKIKNTNLEKFGVENISQSEDIKRRKIETCLKNNGVKYGFSDKEKTQKTINSKYNVSHHFQDPSIFQKQKNTIKEKFGVENISQSKEIKDKKKDTCLKNYGVEFPAQDSSIFENIQKSSYTIKKYKDTNIWYQGSYELDFLERYYKIFPNIKRGPSIKYIYNDQNKIYHSDFYIPSMNLIIEIKNNYLYGRDKNIIELKKESCEKEGYKFLIIIDKKYNELNEHIQSSGNKNPIQ